MRPGRGWGEPRESCQPLTFSKAMRAWVSYTSTVNSVRTPCTWAAGEQMSHRSRAGPAVWPPPRPPPHRQVLPDGLHLLAGEGVVLLLLPVGLDHAQRLLQNLGRR